MNEKFKNIVIALMNIMIALVVLAVIIGGGYYYLKMEKNNEPLQKSVDQRQIAIDKLAAKYDASTKWSENAKYTYQFEKNLTDSGKPIAFTGSVDDIFIEDNIYFIIFDPDYYGDPEIRFILKASPEQVSEITEKSENEDVDDILSRLLGNYAVVAKIDDVKIAELKIDSFLEDSFSETEIDSAKVFYATGNCIDFSIIKYQLK